MRALALVCLLIVATGCHRDWSENATPSDGGTVQDADVMEVAPNAADALPSSVPGNVPSFVTSGAPRSNGSLQVKADGFDAPERTCNAAQRCATASFQP